VLRARRCGVAWLASWQIGGGDYLALRDRLFAEETVQTLADKIEAFRPRDAKS